MNPTRRLFIIITLLLAGTCLADNVVARTRKPNPMRRLTASLSAVTLKGIVRHGQTLVPMRGIPVTVRKNLYCQGIISYQTVTSDANGEYTYTADPLCCVEYRFTPNLPGYLGNTSSTSGCVLYDVSEINTTLMPYDKQDYAGPTSCNTGIGEPVNVTNGNVYLQQTDYQLPGIGPALQIRRNYNSFSPRRGLFGLGWSTLYDEALTITDDNQVRLYTPDGRATYFTRTGGTGAFLPVIEDMRGQITKNANGSYTFTLKDGSVHQFDAAGKLISLTDRNNNQSVLTYDASGLLTGITDPFGRTLSFTVMTYGTYTTGRVLSMSDATGVIATYTYGSYGELKSVTYPDGSKFNMTYEWSSNQLRLTLMTDALGHVVEAHTYDWNARALTSERHGGVERYTLNYVSATETDVTDALGHVTKYFFNSLKGHGVVTRVEGSCSCGGGQAQTQTWAYDNQFNTTLHTDALNQQTTSTFDTQGNVLSKTDASGTTAYTYNQLGQVLTATDAMNGVTTSTYDAQGNLLTVKDALNNTTTFTYNGRGQLSAATDARGNAITLDYDANGNLMRKTDALAGQTNYAYDARGRVTSQTNALGQVTAYTYDAAGRLNRVTYPDNSFVISTYDLAGRRTRITDARNNQTNYAYDEANRLISATDAANQTTTYSYNLMSQLTGRTDPLGRTTNYEYDDFNRLVKTIYPPATTGATRLDERTEYNAAGNVTKRIDTAGRSTLYEYDTSSRLIKVTDPASQVTQFEYNARRNLTAVVDASNQRYAFSYDSLGRVTQSTRGGASMSYAYDAVGNRTQRTDYNGVVTGYAYDVLNRLTTITYPDTTTASYAYDALSRMTSATNENGTVSISYDTRNRVSSIADVWGQTVTYGYDANSNRTLMSVGAGLSVGYQYDALNRLTQLTDNAGAAVSYGYDATSKMSSRGLPNGVTTAYEYDGLGRLTRLTDTKGATTVSDNQYQYSTASQITQRIDQGGTDAYTYDTVGRLSSATHSSAASESYAYDAIGNRLSSHLSASYGYQPFNKLTSTSAATYAYNANGSLTQKTDASGVWQYTWDYENRLKQVIRPDATSVSYKYDALGRRIQRAPSGGVSTNFIYDGQDVVKDINSDGSTVQYLNGLGVDNKIRQTSSVNGTLYYLSDRLGSTRALTDTSGSVVEQLNYDSFGATQGSTRTRYTYTGREWDAEAGLYYYRARWYDPETARFISEDPIGLEGGINLYAYVMNDPVKWRDPSGLDPWIQGELGIGGQFIWGLNGGGGIMINPTTLEVCVYVKGCIRFGLGLIVSAGAKGGLTINGSHCGMKTEGMSFEPVGELAFGKGASLSGSIGTDWSLGVGKGGPGVGLGFSASVDTCYTKPIRCFNSPVECGGCPPKPAQPRPKDYWNNHSWGGGGRGW